MRKPALTIVVSLLLAASVGHARAAAELQQYMVPAGTSSLVYSTGEPNVQSIQFVAGGNPATRVGSITAGNGTASVTFVPPARPSEVTQYFAQNPLGPSTGDWSDWDVVVQNTSSSTLALNFGAHFEPAP